MIAIARIISWSSLAGLTLLPPLLFASGAVEERTLKTLMLGGAILWFATTPVWLRHRPS